MDLSINNYPSQSLTFSAKLNRVSRKAIKNGILKEVRKEPCGSVAMKKFDILSEKADKIEKLLAEKFGEGVFSLHNELGLSPKVTKISFWDGTSFKAFDLPEEVQDGIKVVDKSNIFRTKFKITEFPANKLDWLLEFFSQLTV